MLKIIWYSTCPYSSVGYGNATREILRRFRKDGHEVKIATKHMLGGSIEVDGISCFDGTEPSLVNIIQQEEGYDYIISMADDWVFTNFKFNNWVNCCFLDTHRMHPRLLNASKQSLHTIAATQLTKAELEKNGRECWYAPLGVTTATFKPDLEKRKEFRDSRKWAEDTFVIGSVGINYSTDRKNFIGLLRAFKIFHERHPDSLLYLHTDVMGTSSNGLPLMWVIKEMGFADDGTGAVQYVLQKPYHLWNLSEDHMVKTYNSLDVFAFPTQGEGFGMPIIEAQSCGIPIITTDTTSGEELCKGGWLIETDESDLEFSTHLTWYMQVKANKILAKLELAYDEWKSGKIQERKVQAREGVLEYDWDNVYAKYWRPIFEYLDLEKQGKVFNLDFYPDYKKLYETFGHLFQIGDCGAKEHDKSCERFNPLLLLPNEPGGDHITLLMRSYPLFPDSDGEMYVHTKCIASKVMPPKFVNQCKQIWEYALSFPKVRKALHKLWDENVKDNKEYVKLSDIVTTFDDNYSNVLQTFFHTNFYIGPVITEFIQDCGSFVDIGCGDRRILKQFKELKPEALFQGTEVNNHWIDGKEVIYGDMLKLPFKDGEFDCVISIDVLEHTIEPRKALSELFRVANKKLIITVNPLDEGCFDEDPTHVVKWRLEQWKRELNEFGEIRIIKPDNNACTFLMEKRQED